MTLCECGCGQKVKSGNRFIHNHNKGNLGKKHPGLNHNFEIDQWLKNNQNKHFCQCGCGEIIKVERRHYNYGVPKFILGHNRKKSDIIRICEVCGNEFIAKGNQTQNKKKTCSKECQYKAVSIKNSQVRVERTTKVCKQCGNEFEVIPCELHQIFCTHKCYTDWYSENLKGENHCRWDPNLTAKERLNNESRTHSKEYITWRKAIFKRDGYICQVCNELKSGNLNAHHIMGWNKYINLRFDIDNGITLCKKCHDEFHYIYGKGNNTKEQFIEFCEVNK